MEQGTKMHQALKLLGDPHLILSNVFHITGTAGKTSIGMYISSVLRQAGYSVNMYANGNIYPNNRRIVLNGVPITDNELSSNIAYVQSVTSANGIVCNEEETLFLAALTAFKKEPAESNIIEVATGNTEDPTNVFQRNQPIANIVSTIHADHITTNGNTPELNAISQSGTINKHSTIVLGKQTKNIDQFFTELASIQSHKVYRFGKEFWIDAAESKPSESGSIKWNNQLTFSTEWNSTTFRAKQIKYLPYQLQNIAVALMAIEENTNTFPNVDERAISLGIQTTNIEGQMQKLSIPQIKAISQQHNVYIEYATNAIGGQQIKEGIKKLQALLKQNTHIIISADRTSNTVGLLNELKEHIRSCTIVPNLNTINPLPANSLLQIATSLKVPNPRIATSLLEGLKVIVKEDPKGQTIIVGCASLAGTIEQGHAVEQSPQTAIQITKPQEQEIQE